MDRETTSGGGSLVPFLFGAVVGGAVALLFAPCTGTEMRKKIGNGFGALRARGAQLLEDAEDVVEEKLDEAGRKKSNKSAVA